MAQPTPQPSVISERKQPKKRRRSSEDFEPEDEECFIVSSVETQDTTEAPPRKKAKAEHPKQSKQTQFTTVKQPDPLKPTMAKKASKTVVHRKSVEPPDYPFPQGIQTELNYRDLTGLRAFFEPWSLDKSKAFMEKVGIPPGRDGTTKSKRAIKLANWEMANRVKRTGTEAPLQRPPPPPPIEQEPVEETSPQSSVASSPRPTSSRNAAGRVTKAWKGVGNKKILYGRKSPDPKMKRKKDKEALARYWWNTQVRMASEEEPEVLPRGVWPERYPNKMHIPIWGLKRDPTSDDRHYYMTRPIRGMDVMDAPGTGYDEDLKCQEWGHLGWQMGWISRLRSETESRRMNYNTNPEAHSFCAGDPVFHRNYLRSIDNRDPTGKVDVEAYARTNMLLNYELEAAVRRFGGDVLENVQKMVTSLQHSLHQNEYGSEGNDDDEFVDPGVGEGYQKVDVGGSGNNRKMSVVTKDGILWDDTKANITRPTDYMELDDLEDEQRMRSESVHSASERGGSHRQRSEASEAS